ncbi:MAG: Hsp20/alpha crystallin family protein [Synechococcales cyanobacterium C42_A2020_086]|jgi:HSP20 family protein|nr:Hsp20/alpha crystallin family protein [Synechococcales cyanobacterium M58_A2018_015]MBF2076636.1 Hsp20/alpha crystallin family protein [Synechococcales cyanobacterium C42_A2020_086]
MAIVHLDPLEEMTHWEPFRGISSLQREINRLFDRLLPSGDGEIRSLTFVPSAEMEETDDAIHLRLEVPGMESKDLEVEVTEESVSIRGERKTESKTEARGMIRSEFHYGKFERRISLPAHIQTDKVQAECKNGVLTLMLPKVESEQRKVVKVNIG